MKNILLLSIALLSFTLVSAQSAKECPFASKKSCVSMKQHCTATSAKLAAMHDDNIIKVDDVWGSFYVKKEVCSVTGSTTFQKVTFDSASGTFISCDMKQCDYSKCKGVKKENCKLVCTGTPSKKLQRA